MRISDWSSDVCSSDLIKHLAKPDAHVFMLITGPLMVQGVHNRLFRAWGVRPPSTAFVWIKKTKNFDMIQLEKTPLLEGDLLLSTGFNSRQKPEFVPIVRIVSPSRHRATISHIYISPVPQ